MITSLTTVSTKALPPYSLCKMAKNDNFLRIAKWYHFSNIRYFFEPVLGKKNLTGSKGICNYKTPLSHFRENVILVTFCIVLSSRENATSSSSTLPLPGQYCRKVGSRIVTF